jgi:5'(3')-deoxyribonucleotidase
MHQTILFDVDGVLADLRTPSESFLQEHLRRPDYRLPDLERFTEGLDERLHQTLGLHWATSGFATQLKPYEDALEALSKLRARHPGSLDIVALTAHWDAPTWVFDRRGWLQRHFDIWHKDQIHTHRKDLIHGDWLVEDSSEYAEMWLRRNPNGRVAYINRYGTTPKRPIEGHPRIIVLNDLHRLPEII